MTPHSCNPTIHYKNKQSSALWFLKDHHRLAVIDNRDITPAQIRSDERLRFGNNISYRQAYRVKEGLLIEIECYGPGSGSWHFALGTWLYVTTVA